MEWDKNTKIIVAVVVVVILIGAGVGAYFLTKDNGGGSGGGSKESTAKISNVDWQSLKLDDELPTLYIMDKDGKKVNLQYASAAKLPSGKTTIVTDSDGWVWDSTNKILRNNYYNVSISATNAEFKGGVDNGKVKSELSYGDKADIKLTVVLTDIVIKIKICLAEGSESLPDLFIKDISGAEKQLKVGEKIRLPNTGSAQIYSKTTGWTYEKEGNLFQNMGIGITTLGIHESTKITYSGSSGTGGTLCYTLTYGFTSVLSDDCIFDIQSGK